MRKLVFSMLALSLIGIGSLHAQLTGIKIIPGDYPTLAAAITDLNLQGVGPGGVTFNHTAGSPETAPAGGYVITASGTAPDAITFIGNNNVITASATHTAGALNDGIFKIIGGDYITIGQYVMQENAANSVTTPASNTMTEWGVALLYASATNGAQNNSIVGNNISLNRTYANTFGVYSNTRHTATAVGTTADITAASGSNSNNKVYGNAISNVNLGIAFIGCGASGGTAFQDMGNDIGGNGTITGNIITNWGGLTTSSYISNSGTQYGIFMNHQQSSNISYNTIVSAALSSTSTLRGILQDFTALAPQAGTFTNSITNNTITLTNASSGTFEGIRYQGMSTALSGTTVMINSNSIISCSFAGSMTGIGHSSSAPGVLSLMNNIVRSNTGTGTSSGFTGITNTGAVVTTINITNNQIGNASGNAVTFTAATSGSVTGISNSGGASGATLTLGTNDLRGFVHSATGSSSYTLIGQTAGVLVANVTSNTFTNLNLNTTGSVTFIAHGYAIPSGSQLLIDNNSIVTGFTKTAAGGTVALTSSNSTSGTGSVNNYTNNNFSNITVTGGTTLTGFNNTDGGAGSAKTITGNTFMNWTGGTNAVQIMNITYWNGVSSVSNNIINTISGQAAVTGLNIGSTTNNASSITVSQNTISNLSSTGGSVTGLACANTSALINISLNVINTLSTTAGSTVTGIIISGATNTNVFRNKIYDLSANNAAGVVNGITVSGGTAVTLSNNLVGDLRAPSTSSATDAIRGINLTSTAGSSTINVYYNTVYLAATSTGTNFGTSGIFHTTSATATTAALDLRNNIVVNTSTPLGTGVTAAYRRSSTSLTNYANVSNNNIFYAGTPSATNVIFTDGTNLAQTIGAFIALVGPTRESVSRSENVPFVSTTGSSVNFLHVNTAVATFAESGGANITGFTVDFDNDIRQGNPGYTGAGTAPDVGADEFEGTPVPMCMGTPVAGTITGSAAVCSGAGTTLTLTGASSDPGISYQWQSSLTPGGPYTNMGTLAAQATGNLTATTYYIVTVTCSFSSMSANTTEFTVAVNALPTVSVSPTSTQLCNPGATAVTLAATGAATYAWGPAAGLSATTGASVNALPAASTTYTVTGTDGNGCTNTATAAITVRNTPSVPVVTPPTANLCTGGNIALTATSTVSNTLGTGTSTTTLSSTGSANFPNPYAHYYGGNKHQMLILASELTAMGYTAGTQITTLGFPVASVNRTDALAGFQISMGHSTLPALTAFQTGLTLVLPAATYTTNAVAGVNTHTLATPFVWNGTDNIIIETSYSNNDSPSTGNVTMTFGATAFQSTIVYRVDNTSAATVAAYTGTPSFTLSARPNITFGTAVTGSNITWSPAATLSASTGNTVTATPAATTTYSVTANNNGCVSAAGTATVTLDPFTAVAVSAAPGTTVCAGTNVTLNAAPTGGGAPYTYAWSGPNSFSSSAQNPVLTAPTAAASGTYTLVVTDNCATTFTVNITLTVNALPAVSVSSSASVYCGTTPVSFNATGATTYTWSPAYGLSATTGSSVTATPAGYGINTYVIQGTDGNGCVGSATTTLTSSLPPTVTASASDSTICMGDSINLMAAVPATDTRLAQDFTNGLQGWTITNGASSPVVSNWAVRTPPYNNTSLVFTNFATPSGGNFLMSDSDAGGSGSTTNTVFTSPVFSTVGLTTANLTFENLYQRWNSGDVTVAVEVSTDGGSTWAVLQAYTSSQGVVTTNAQVPANASISLGAYLNQSNMRVRFNYVSSWGYYWILDNIRVSGNTTYPYAWTSSPVGFTSSVQNPTDVVPAGNTDYTVSITNQAGCSSSDAVSVSLNALPTVVASSTAAAVCSGDPVTLTGSGAVSYTWTGSVTNAVPFTPAATDTYTVTGTDGNGCTDTDVVTVTVNALPTVVANTTATAVCDGNQVTLTGSGATSYVWTGSVTDNVAFTPAATDTYTVTGTDGNGCTDTDVVTVTVNALPTVVANTTATAVCDGNQVTLTGSGATSYVWTGSVTDNVAFTPAATDTYTVTGTDGNGCTDTDVITVTVNALPTVVANSTATAVCDGDQVTLSGSGADTYTWTGSVSDNVAFTPLATDTYTVTGTDLNGCSNTDVITVTVNALPAVTASATDTVICAGDSVMVMGGGASTYVWTGGVIDAMNFAPATTDTYTVTGTDANGCTNTAAVMITVNAAPTVTLSLPLDTVCMNFGVITLSGETPVGGVWTGSGVSGNTFDPAVAGVGMVSIMYTYTDSINGCSATTTDMWTVDICNGIEGTATATVELYPNPNNGEFTIIPSGSGVVDVLIYNAAGQLISAEKANCGQQNPIRIDASGMYTIAIVTADGQRTTQRVIVNR